jgi:hypothetical protein
MAEEKAQSQMSLAQLNQISAKPAPQREVVAEGGDSLIDKARSFLLPSHEEKRLANLFKESEAIVQQRAEADPVFGEQLGAKIDALTKAGKIDDVPQVIIDAADEEKIKILQQEKPQWFTSKDAALTGFLDEATFGQLSKIIGKANELIDGRPYEEVVSEKAEQFRLLSKTFPGWTTAGQAASYLVPGSPVKAIFQGATKLAATGAIKAASKSLVKKMVTSPTAIKALSGAAQSAVAGAVGTGAVSAIRGGLGSDLQDLDRDVNTALMSAATDGIIGTVVGGALGGAIPLAGNALSYGAKKAAPTLKSLARSFEKNVGRAAGELTGSSERSLRAYNRDPKLLEMGAKIKPFDKGEEMVAVLESKAFNSESLQVANEILPMLGEVDAAPVINQLRSIKKTNNAKLDPVVDYLQEWANRLEQKLSRGSATDVLTDSGLFTKRVPGKLNTMISAQEMNAWKKELARASDSWGMELGGSEAKKLLTKGVHQASHKARKAIEEVAEAGMKSGDPALAELGDTYIKNMRQAAKEAKLVNSMLEMLGKKPEVRQQKAEAFFDRALGKNRTIQLKRMEQLDAELGTSFVKEATAYQYAKELGGKSGPQAKPSFFNTTPTGRSAYGIGIGAALGAANEVMTRGNDEAFDAKTGAAAGAILTSPRVAAGVLGASGQISGFVRRMLANPEALNRLASGAVKTKSATVERLLVPIEVQRVAQAIQKTLTEDGPKSAASLTRNVADTPYFLGLAHFFDIADKAMQSKQTRQAMERTKYEDAPEIAR